MPLRTTSVGATARIDVSCDARWLMAFSAAIGAMRPEYFDTRAGVVGHPMFTVGPEWALLTQRRDPFQLGLTREEASRGVHATHRLLAHRPVRQGDELELTAEMVGIETIRSGALATVHFAATSADGSPVWTSWMGTIYRDVEVVGENRPARTPALPPADHARRQETVQRRIAPGDAHVYTECARIWNPIHTDVAYAQRAGLPGTILHGTATLAHAVTSVMEWLGLEPTHVTQVAGAFRAMVPLPSVLEVVMRDASTDGDGVCAFDVLVEGRPAVRGGLVAFAR
jgi:acyl dehydratase